MERTNVGEYESSVAGGEVVRAFTPVSLPPDPELAYDRNMMNRLAQASLAVGRLDGLSLIPDIGLFLYQYVRKEAVLSSQIEGTQSTLDDLLTYEDGDTPGVPFDDVVEVSNYVSALNYGIDRIFKDNFPICLRLIKEMHSQLLSSGRGSDKTPGEFKRSQNWLGGTIPKNAVFVPTPPHRTVEAMGSLEQFLQDRGNEIPALIVAGLVHVQFETIHPFLDGNGRLGRMLIPLLLCERGILKQPLLYLSLFFKENREEYYSLLQHVRMTGDWERWINFFLYGVTQTANNAVDTALQMHEVFKRDRVIIEDYGKASVGVLKTHEYLFGKISANATQIAESTGVSFPTVNTSLQALEGLGIIKETTGKQRGRRYLYGDVHQALSLGLGDFSRQEEEGPSLGM